MKYEDLMEDHKILSLRTLKDDITVLITVLINSEEF